MILHDQDFSLDRLKAMYYLSLERGYTPVLYGDDDDRNDPFILWRHDIDIELPAAITIAKLEAQLGIKSTYFLMTRSSFYNLFSREGIETVCQLENLGHRIGLHCDLLMPRDADVSLTEIEDKVMCDFMMVDAAFPSLFRRVVSFHNPPTIVLGRGFMNFHSAYQPKFFSHIKYLSDSNRRWRDGSPEQWFDIELNPRLAILLHPIIWTYPGRVMSEAMEVYLKQRSDICREMLIRDDVEV